MDRGFGQSRPPLPLTSVYSEAIGPQDPTDPPAGEHQANDNQRRSLSSVRYASANVGVGTLAPGQSVSVL